MIIAELPLDENERLKDLYSYDILNSASESDFDDLVELASQICECPVSLITLLDKDLQWFKSKKGIDGTSTSRDAAFCSHAILQDEVMVVENALQDERFFDNPFVVNDPNIRFYAGAPIVSPGGQKLGTICTLDHKPRTLAPEQKRALMLLSNQVTRLLEIRRKNIQIRERAKEIITLKSSAIKTFLHDTETLKEKIAVELHEDFAQSIASCVMLLKHAEENPAVQLENIKAVREQLSDTLRNIRSLSYNVTPLMVKWMATEEMIAEYISKASAAYPFPIQFESGACSTTAHPDITVTAIRVAEQWLKCLAYKKQVSIVNISVTVNGELCILIKDNELMTDANERERDILQYILFDQLYAYGGSIEFTTSRQDANTVKIVLPANIPSNIISGQAV